MPADYITQVLLAGSDGTSIVPIMVDNQGRIILTGAGMQDYIPVIGWSGPISSYVDIIARWKRVAGLVFFYVNFFTYDNQGVYPTSVSLPYPAHNSGGNILVPVTAFENSVYPFEYATIPSFINTGADNTILSLQPIPASFQGHVFMYFINGVYEALT